MLSNQTVNNARFNEEAAKWDTNKKHFESVEKAFEAIRRNVPAFKDGSSKGEIPKQDLPCHCDNYLLFF